MMTTCRECNHAVATDAMTCPSCGTPRPAARPPTPEPPQEPGADRRRVLLALGFLVAMVAVLFAVRPLFDDEAPAAALPAGCEAALRSMAADKEGAAPAFEALVDESLTACQDSETWLTAARRYPAAVGVRSAEFVNDISLQAACGGGERMTLPVCRDAASDGRL